MQRHICTQASSALVQPCIHQPAHTGPRRDHDSSLQRPKTLQKYMKKDKPSSEHPKTFSSSNTLSSFLGVRTSKPDAYTTQSLWSNAAAFPRLPLLYTACRFEDANRETLRAEEKKKVHHGKHLKDEGTRHLSLRDKAKACLTPVRRSEREHPCTISPGPKQQKILGSTAPIILTIVRLLRTSLKISSQHHSIRRRLPPR